jgi:hypothetical protein
MSKVTYSPVASEVPHPTAELLYLAELALEDARSSGVDSWIKAAADRLHEAVRQYLLQRAEVSALTAARTAPEVLA